MAITVTVTESPTYITVDEANLTVTLNQSDNPITITTSSDLTLQAGEAEQILYTATGSLAGGNVQDALGDLADQFFRQSSTPSGSNLAEGDLWYDTTNEELRVYREISSGSFAWIALAAGGYITGETSLMDKLDGGFF